MAIIESLESLAFCVGLVTGIAGLAPTRFHPQPLTRALWPVLGMMGVFCVTGTQSYHFAIKHTLIGNLSQYYCTRLVTGVMIFRLIWRDKAICLFCR